MEVSFLCKEKMLYRLGLGKSLIGIPVEREAQTNQPGQVSGIGPRGFTSGQLPTFG